MNKDEKTEKLIGLSKKSQTARNGRLRDKPLKDKEYLSWIHNQCFGCMVCGNTNIEVHHIGSGSRGRADDKVVILCPEHHKGRFSPHGADAKEFFEEHTKETMYLIAKVLYGKYLDEK